MSKAACSNLNLLDSEEYFWELVVKRGLAAEGLPFGQRLWENGWCTAGAFTYACGVNPSVVDDETFNARVLNTLTKKGARSKYAMDIRRLWHQCQMLHEADNRRVHEAGGVPHRGGHVGARAQEAQVGLVQGTLSTP